jgi:hypothetical protein
MPSGTEEAAWGGEGYPVASRIGAQRARSARTLVIFQSLPPKVNINLFVEPEHRKEAP